MAILVGFYAEIGLIIFILTLFIGLVSVTFSKEKFFILIILMTFTLGLVRMIPIQNEESELLKLVEEGKYRATAVIVDEPDVRESNTIYIVEPEGFGERIRLHASHNPKFSYGDEIEIYGTLEKPENFQNKNGIEFNYISFLSKSEIYTIIFRPKIDLISQNKASKIKLLLFQIKSFFIERLNDKLPSPHAELSGGLLLGAKQSLGKEMLDNFRKVGLIHIVVLSGYNITIIAEAIKRVFGFLPNKVNLIFSAISIIFFVMMVGGSATIVRAGIMTLLVLLSKNSSRRYQINRALLFAGFLMVLHNPKILLYDPGFQLSFVATIGLVHISPIIEKFIYFIPSKFGIKEIVSATIATQIAVLPLLISMTGEISTVALLVNMLVLPIIPLTMLASFVSALSFGPKILTVIISLPAYLLLEYQLKIVEFFAAFSFVTFDLTSLF